MTPSPINPIAGFGPFADFGADALRGAALFADDLDEGVGRRAFARDAPAFGDFAKDQIACFGSPSIKIVLVLR
jgi:hypothetical protein